MTPAAPSRSADETSSTRHALIAAAAQLLGLPLFIGAGVAIEGGARELVVAWRVASPASSLILLGGDLAAVLVGVALGLGVKRNGTVAPAAFLVATLPVLLGASSMSNSVVGSLNRVGDVPAEVRGAIILEVLGEATACLTLGLCASGALLLAAGLGAAVGSFGVRLSQRLTMRCLSGLAAFGGLWCVALASNAVARARTFVLFGAFRHRGCRSCCAKPSSRCSAAGR